MTQLTTVAEELRDAVRILADLDPDRAHEQNAQGFSAADGPFGHALASLPPPSWTPEITRDAWELLTRYRNQLRAGGLEFDSLPVPQPYPGKQVTVDSSLGPRKTTKGRAQVLGFARANRSGHIPMIRLDGTDAYVDSARDQKLIAAVKAIPGRRWLGNPPLWLVPVGTSDVADALIELAATYEMVVPEGFTAQLKALTDGAGESEPAGIRLDETGDQAIVRTGYRPGAFEAMAKITTARYDKATDTWKMPFTESAWSSLLGIAERFSLPVDDALHIKGEEVFAQVVRSYKEAVALEPSGRITEIPGMVDPPGKPFDKAQWAGVEYIVDHHSGCLVADEPGVAKTAETYAALAYLGRKRIVWVCPQTAKEKMQHEANTRFPSWQTAIVDGRRTDASKKAIASFEADRPALLILNYDVLVAHKEVIASWLPDALVCDEAHRLKEEKTSWTKAVKGTAARKGQEQQIGLAEEVRSRGGSVLLLTGTPMPNGPWELISLLRIIDKLDALGGWKHFATHFCGARQESLGGRKVARRTIWVMDKRQNLGELNVLLRQHGMLRRRLRDVCPELECLPPEFVDAELDSVYLAEYRQAEKDIAEYMAQKAAQLAREIGADPHSAAVRAKLKVKMAEDAIELAVLRRLIGMAKLPSAVAWAQEFLELNSSGAMAELDGEEDTAPAKLAVAAYHRDVVAAMHEALGGVAITGGSARGARDKARHAFQEDPDVRVITCSILAAGEAIELTAAHTTLVVEYDWVPKTHQQWVGRLYRRGQSKPVRPVYMHAENTTDDVQKGVLETKDEAAEHAIDGVAPAGDQASFVDIESQMMDELISIGERTR